MRVRDVPRKRWEAVIVNNSHPSLVLFWCPWCEWSRKLTRVLEELSPLYDGRLNFYAVNVEGDGELAERYGVKSVPTLMFFYQGKPLYKLVGYHQPELIKEELDKVLRIYRACLDQSSSLTIQ
ncbi:MAG: thiol reductase thioredoxin [Nitrososphaerota archaeon]